MPAQRQNRLQSAFRRSGLTLATAGVCLATLAVAAAVLAFSGGCQTIALHPNSRDYQPPTTVTLVATGYCNCQKCCDWHYTWYGRSVTNSGRPKKVGVTASGTRARRGTIAADTSVYPLGTIIEIPGYGFGRVEDRGGAIKGKHVDLWFRRHSEALHWGKRNVKARIWLPKKR